MDRTHLIGRLAELGHNAAGERSGVPLYAPASAEQAAELLGECSRQGWRVRLEGAGSRSPAAPPADLAISARSLTGFDIYEPDDLTVGVRAGTTHTDAAEMLGRHQQFLPLDPPGPPAATLGGSAAMGSAGPLRAGYGTPRDLVLGINLVAGDGRLLRLGGQVVKNVAGYDLVRLVVGSRGTLGLIAQLHVRLRSLPPCDLTLVAELNDGAEAAAVMLPLRDAVAPVALELLTPDAASAPWRVCVRLHGGPESTAAAEGAVRRLLPGARPLEPLAAAELWRTLAATEAAAAVHLRCTALPTGLPTLLAASEILLNYRSNNGIQAWRGAAHGTEGMLRLWTSDGAHAAGEGAASLLSELRELVVTAGGTCICDRGPETARVLLPAAAPAPRLLALERELRLRFDPGSVLVGD